MSKSSPNLWDFRRTWRIHLQRLYRKSKT